VDTADAAIIDFTEAAYDLERGDEEWLPEMMMRGLRVLDQGLGVAAVEYGRLPEGGPVTILKIHVGSGPGDFPERHLAALAAMPPELLRDQARPGQAATMSQSQAGHPEALEIYTKHVDYCKDVFGITAVDARGAGVAIVAPLPKVTSLSPQETQRWEMLAAHLDAGHRLRQSLAAKDEPPAEDALPYDAEAIFDPKNIKITDAIGKASERAAREKLREAAVSIDRARGSMRNTNPQQALETWRALVRGRWSTVDWFDTDGRRYVLALPNSPEVTDPRGLTERERQVVAYAALGQTNKMIGYRLGLSRSRVSLLIRSAMRKLGVRTRVQLVSRVREFDAMG
jgi:DNA-binding CsgD family transcriptional regulator